MPGQRKKSACSQVNLRKAHERLWLHASQARGARENPDSNRWFYYYAEAADGSGVWNGPYAGEVQRKAFAECRGCIPYVVQQNGEPQYFPAPPWREVGYAELDTNTYGGVNLND